MRRVLIHALLASMTLAAACNSKSPEQQADATESDEKAVDQVAPESAPEPEPKKPDPLPALSAPHHDGFDFLNNRPHAHRMERIGEADALVIDAAAPDFVRYIHGNHPSDWSLEVELEGVKSAALRKKRKATIWAPGATHNGPVQIRVYSPRSSNSLTLKINGKKTDPVELEEGWQTVTIPTTANQLADENEIELDFSNMGRIAGSLSGGAVEWIRLGAAREAEPVEAAPAAVDAKASDAGARAEKTSDSGADVGVAPTMIPPPSRQIRNLPREQGAIDLSEPVMWTHWVLPSSKIDLVLEGPAGCGVEVRVWKEDGAGSTVPALLEKRQLVEGIGDEQKTFVDLSDLAGQVVRTVIRPEGCESVEFKRAALVVPGEKPQVPNPKRPKYILFWMIDTLRADHLPIHFETNVEAPNLKRIAEEGASFKVAYVQGNESKTSHASLFSGMFPSKHGVVGRGSLKPWKTIMPEAIREAGYNTGAYISNGYVSQPWGFVQGWNFYLNNLRENYRIDGRSMAEMGLKWMKENADKGELFMYLGTIDPHVTYRRHDEIIGRYDTEPYSGRFNRACYGEDLGKIKGGSIKVTERDKVRIQNLYKNEVTYNDIAFGEIRAGLEEAGMWDETMVVITSDHGDEFWEHGSVGHGHSIHQDQVHVPLIFYYPPLVPKGTVVEAGADVLDIYPTIMEAIGADRPEGVQGKSLLDLIHKVNGDYPEPAAATQYKIHYAMQMQQWKLYLRRGEYQIYDRANDHNEQTDVSKKHPLASRWLLDSMGWFRAHRDTWDKVELGAASNLRPGFYSSLAELEK